MAQGGIQTVETMLYTLDQINKQWTKFKIGALILDDCDKDTYGLEMAIDFIKGQFWTFQYHNGLFCWYIFKYYVPVVD